MVAQKFINELEIQWITSGRTEAEDISILCGSEQKQSVTESSFLLKNWTMKFTEKSC